MNKDKTKIELRSEKVRNIISNELPFLIRYGITFVAVVLTLMAIITWWFIKDYVV